MKNIMFDLFGVVVGIAGLLVLLMICAGCEILVNYWLGRVLMGAAAVKVFLWATK